MRFEATIGGYGRLLALILAVGVAAGLPARGADTVPAKSAPATAGDSAAAPTAVVVEAADGWVRWLPGDLPAAGYVTLTNKGPTTLELVGVSSADYAEVSMHQTRQDHGMSEMRQVASLVLKPQATVRFEEGGYHLMLMHAKRQLHQHDRVEIVFRFSDGRTMPVPFEVRSGLGG